MTEHVLTWPQLAVIAWGFFVLGWVAHRGLIRRRAARRYFKALSRNYFGEGPN